MNRFRYVDKDILCSYNLSEELFSKLGLEIYDMIPLRKVFVLFTNKGKKILKICNFSNERIEFIDKVLKYIEKKDKNILQYCRNSSGDLITTWDNRNYILLDMIDGREAAYTNPVDIALCAEAISKMHISSCGIDSLLDYTEKSANSSISVIEQYKSDFKTICQFENMVNKFKYKNEFDLLFLNIVDKCKTHIDKSIDLLQVSSYNNFIKFKTNLVLCHNDLAHHNFIIDNTNVNIIDFDYCKLDIRIIDIANYSGKVLKSTSYDTSILDSILKSYGSISNEELEMLYGLFMYPKDFVNIVKSYYLKEKSWSEEVFISRFKNKIELDIFRCEFLKELKIYN